MIKLIFIVGRETVSIEIKDKIIVYRDRKFPSGIKFLPMDKDFEKIVTLSRNRIPKEIVTLIRNANSGKNLEEYQDAKDDEDLAVIVKKDAGKGGCVFQKRIDI